MRETNKPSGTDFSPNDDGVVILQATMDGELQKLVKQLLRQHVLYTPHHHLLAGDSEQRRMYETTLRDYYWPNMAFNVYHTVSNCNRCAKHRPNYIKNATFKYSQQQDRSNLSAWISWQLSLKQPTETDM